jgi:DNA modification methylase
MQANSDPGQVKLVPTGKLRPNPRNARTHSKKQLKKIAASIQNCGFIGAIIIDQTGTILAGHGRWLAAQMLGLAEVPTIEIDHLSPAQKRAYVLADNRIAEQAGWDREILAIEFGELLELLPAKGLDISLTGFDPAEIDLILEDMEEGKPSGDDSSIDDASAAVSRRGDLWLLGKHRLLCGDARLPAEVDRLMAGEKAVTAVTDPPFNRAMDSIGGRGQSKHADFAFASGEMSQSEFTEFLNTTLGNATRVSVDGGVHYVFMDWRHMRELLDCAGNIYSEMLNLCVWNKTNAGQGSFYRSQHELIGVFRVGNEPHQNNVELGRFGRSRTNVWTYPGVNSFGAGRIEALRQHPTVKPVALIADALRDCTRKGDAVLDIFAGSGTIFLASEKVGRRAFGLEIEPRYVDVAIKRWESMTRRDAVLVDDGRTFTEIAASKREAAGLKVE